MRPELLAEGGIAPGRRDPLDREPLESFRVARRVLRGLGDHQALLPGVRARAHRHPERHDGVRGVSHVPVVVGELQRAGGEVGAPRGTDPDPRWSTTLRGTRPSSSPRWAAPPCRSRGLRTRAAPSSGSPRTAGRTGRWSSAPRVGRGPGAGRDRPRWPEPSRPVGRRRRRRVRRRHRPPPRDPRPPRPTGWCAGGAPRHRRAREESPRAGRGPSAGAGRPPRGRCWSMFIGSPPTARRAWYGPGAAGRGRCPRHSP